MREDIKDNRNQKIGMMDRQASGTTIIYNKSGSKIGEIKPNSDTLVAYDKNFRKLGYWQKGMDCTYEPNGRKIGKGNLLLSLYF